MAPRPKKDCPICKGSGIPKWGSGQHHNGPCLCKYEPTSEEKIVWHDISCDCYDCKNGTSNRAKD